jgi:type I restriction enzyme S subunit
MSNQASLDEVSQKSTEQVQDTSKHTEIRIGPKKFRIPEKWESEEIGSIGSLVTGDTPSTDNEDYFGEKYPFITPEDLKKYKYPVEVQRGLTEAGLKESREIPAGSVIMDCIGSDLGKVGITKTTSATNQQINAIIPEGDWNSEFIYYFLQEISPIVKSQAGSTATPILRKSSFSSLEVLKPPVLEQRRIASVLHNLDQAIQKTEEIIGQTQKVKKGLMQDLFTDGYYEHEEFEEEGPLNRRPKSWNIESLSDVAAIEMGSSPKSEFYNEEGEGLPFYQGNNEFGDLHPVTEVWCSNPVKTADKDDILISVRAPVGDLNIASEECCIGRGLAGITAQEIDRDYLFYHLRERKKFLTRISAGSTYDSINSSQLKNLKLKLPEADEQREIADALKSLDDKVRSNKRQKKQLQRLKTGLMQDLLTGEIRTNENVEVLSEVIEVEE